MLIGRRAAGRGVSKRSIQQDPWGVFQVGTGARAMVLMPNQGSPGIPSAGDEGQGRKDDLPPPLGCHFSVRCDSVVGSAGSLVLLSPREG